MRAAAWIEGLARQVRPTRGAATALPVPAEKARAAWSVARQASVPDTLVRSATRRGDRVVSDATADVIRHLSQGDLALLTRLSDPKRVTTMDQLHRNLEEIASTFARTRDTRGLFASVYAPTTARVMEARASGHIRDIRLSDALSLDFGKRYLENLHAHLQGRPVSAPWARYYELALASEKPSFRVLATGMNAHLTVDLPAALAAVKAPASFKRDYLQLGRAMSDGTSALVARVKQDHGLDLSRLFEGYSPGRALSRVFGPNAPTRAIFQGIRNEAWCQGHLLQEGGTAAAFARRQTVASFRLRQGLLELSPI
jgi:hypothetical protein